MQPLVSIIIPAFNAERYFDECLQSVRGQTHTNLEIIIVDDGSSDNTHAIAVRHADADERIVILQQPNRGVSVARNLGILSSKGHFLCFFDADDVMYLNSIECRLRQLLAEHADFVYANHRVVDEKGHPVRENRSATVGDDPLLHLLESPTLGIQTVMVRRTALSATGLFRPRQSHLEDWDLWIRCADAGLRFTHLAAFVNDYREHSEGATCLYDLLLVQGVEMLDRYSHLATTPARRRAWRRGRYGVMRAWIWQVWDEPCGIARKLGQIAGRSVQYHQMPLAFAAVVWNSLAKRTGRGVERTQQPSLV